MARHVEAWIDGNALSDYGPYIIREVREDAPSLEISAGSLLGRYGQRMLGRKRTSLKVTIEVLIRELYDLSRRSRAAEELARWASGSVLQLSNHPNRRLLVHLSAEPALGEVRDYNSVLRLEFTADEVPYWEDKLTTDLSLSGLSDSGSLTVPGTAETPICLTVTPEDELTEFTVAAGGRTIALSGFSIAQGGTLTISRDLIDGLAVRSGNVSLLRYRSAASADDLMVPPGPCAVSFSADISCDVAVTVRGRWM